MAGALHRGKEEYRISPESFPGVFRRALKCVEENTAGVLQIGRASCRERV